MSKFSSSGKLDEDIPKQKFTFSHLKESLFIFKFIQPYKVLFIFGFILLISSSLISLLFPKLLGDIIDIAVYRSSKSIFGNSLTQIGIVIVVLLIFNAIFTIFRIKIMASIGEKATADIRLYLFSKILNLPLHFFHQNRVGDLISRLSNDLAQIQDTLSNFLANIIRQFMVLIFGMIYVVYMFPKLSAVFISIVPLLVVMAILFGKKIKKNAKETQNTLAQTNTILEEVFQSISSVKIFTNEKFETNRYQKGLQMVVNLAVKNAWLRALFAGLVLLAMMFAILIVMWIGLQMVQDGTMKIGALQQFIFYGLFIAGSMAGFTENYNQLQKTLGSTQRLKEIIQEQSEYDTENESLKLEFNQKISFSNLSFSYPSRPENLILDQINFEIPKGKKVALVGQSGAGKSTIAQILQGFYIAEKGHLRIDHQIIDKTNISHLRKLIAQVPQEVILFGGTIYDNILYGNINASYDQVIEASKIANAYEFISQFPEQFNTIVGDRGIKLSGGQRQRIAIARAILKNPEILILDEATSSLDAESETLVQAALNNVMKNRTSLIIAHRLSTLKDVDLILVLENGNIIDSGTHQALIDKKTGLYHQLFQLQQLEEYKS